MNYSDYKNVYIGQFECTSNCIDVLDPHLCPVNMVLESIPVENEKKIHLRRISGGVYNCYHLVDLNNHDPLAMCAIQSGYNISEVRRMPAEFCGSISSHIGNAVVFVDGNHVYDTKNLYYPIVDDAYYDAEVLKSKLSKMPYDEKVKEVLKKKIEKRLKENGYISGNELFEIIQCSPVWSGFSEFYNDTNAWSCECEKSLYESHIPAVSIFKGIVSFAKPDIQPCYVHRNFAGDVVAISISLVGEMQ